jgi:hypothetical protein
MFLTGLTSNGGPEGGGTHFSIKSDGTVFSIIKVLLIGVILPTGIYSETVMEIFMV